MGANQSKPRSNRRAPTYSRVDAPHSNRAPHSSRADEYAASRGGPPPRHADDYYPAGRGREDHGAQPPRREMPRPAGRKNKGGRKGLTVDNGRFIRRK
jgi:hypothetical protein